jgi:hypothetical protein
LLLPTAHGRRTAVVVVGEPGRRSWFIAAAPSSIGVIVLGIAATKEVRSEEKQKRPSRVCVGA